MHLSFPQALLASNGFVLLLAFIASQMSLPKWNTPATLPAIQSNAPLDPICGLVFRAAYLVLQLQEGTNEEGATVPAW